MSKRGRFIPSKQGSVLGVSLLAYVLLVAANITSTTAAELRDLSSSITQQRLGAVEFLRENWKTELDPVLREIASFKGEIDVIADAKDHQRLLYFRALTDALRLIINDGGRYAIDKFRSLDNHDVIDTLVRAARGANRGIRINSTIILANVSDNSSICIAIDELRDPEIHDSGRLNLLQVVQTVASYMYQENFEATKTSLEIVEASLNKNSAKENARALNIIKDIYARLSRTLVQRQL